MRKLAAALALVVWGSLLLLACESESPEQIALKAAKKWADDNVGKIASFAAERLVADQPVLAKVAASLIENQIKDKVQWSFSAPVKKADGRYEVVAKATAPVNIKVPLVVDKAYDISVDYKLDVDTKAAKVVESRLDPTSLSIKQR